MTKGLSLPVITFLIGASIFGILDAFFVYFRPHTLKGGKLDYYPMPLFQQYAKHDTRYVSTSDQWVRLQSYLNIVDAMVNFAAIGFNLGGRYGIAHKLVILSNTCCGYKTALYLLLEAMEGFPYTKHNSSKNYWLYCVAPLGLIIASTLLIIRSSFMKLRAVDDHPAVAHKEHAATTQKKSYIPAVVKRLLNRVLPPNGVLSRVLPASWTLAPGVTVKHDVNRQQDLSNRNEGIRNDGNRNEMNRNEMNRNEGMRNLFTNDAGKVKAR